MVIPAGMKIEANGGSTSGKGGEVTFSAGGVMIAQPTDPISASALASGDGGRIKLTALELTLITTLDARGNGSSGDGGEIEITTEEPVDITQSRLLANADKNNMGLGGKVTVDRVVPSNPVNVNFIIKVDGGDSIGDAAFAGFVKLNGIKCQQWQTGLNSWPKTWWDCVNPDNPTGSEATIADAANSLQAGLKSLLGTTLTPNNPSVQIYVMPTVNSYRSFFGAPTNNPQGDLFTYGISSSGSSPVGSMRGAATAAPRSLLCTISLARLTCFLPGT
ncbi:MAG TPA: hypothetical protein V6D17_09740 [Candidatus Obscuribacterales bacterium]